MTKTKKQLLALTVILTVCLIHFFSPTINIYLWNGENDSNFYLKILGQILKNIVPVLIVLFLFYQPSEVLGELGLSKDFLGGLKYAFFFTIPMLVGYYFLGEYNTEKSLIQNILTAFKDGFREEIFFRAFLFGQLFRQVKIGFLPAVLINGFIFALLHLYQAHSMEESLGVFAVTFAGAIWFAWLFIEWEENLWLPILMHFFMNFYWHLFSTENSALGGLLLNLPRALTIALSIYWTLKMMRQRGNRKINTSNFVMFNK
jgi:uncharacterized protein